MPDTTKTTAELKTIFADNTAGDITASDLRDFAVSVLNTVDTPVTAFAETLLDDTSASVARTTLGLGTASTHDVPASGNATSGQVVLGNDSRLSGGWVGTATSDLDMAGHDIKNTIIQDASAVTSVDTNARQLWNTAGDRPMLEYTGATGDFFAVIPVMRYIKTHSSTGGSDPEVGTLYVGGTNSNGEFLNVSANFYNGLVGCHDIEASNGARVGILQIDVDGNITSVLSVNSTNFEFDADGNGYFHNSLQVGDNNADTPTKLLVDPSSAFQANPIMFYGADGTTPITQVDADGNVTATSFVGDGSALTNLAAGNIASGTVATARLGSGSATSSTILFGDQTYKAVSSLTLAESQVTNLTTDLAAKTPTSRTVTINGSAHDLSADRSYSVGTVTSVATSGLATGGTITGSGTVTVTAAVKSDQTTATSTTTAVTPAVQQFHPSAAKAWVKFDGKTSGTATIKSSYNVASVTRTGTGLYTVTFTTAFTSADAYVCSGIGVEPGSHIGLIYLNGTIAAGSIAFGLWDISNVTFFDGSVVMLTFFGTE